GGKRVASVQKCIRTGDIDEVGDDVHLTFFEMLGNWSFGDYWKKEAIEWSFEFLTRKLGLLKEKLAVSCFAGDNDAPRDEESAKVWEALGISKNRIYFFGKKDNWWGPAGETGPCGPDTEMFYWTGKGEPEPLITADNKSGWVEIWNDVFMEYNKTADGKFEQLKQKNVDTGMGLERTLTVLNGKANVYEVDEFKPIISKIKELAGKSDERATRIIADHIKASVFIVGDAKGIAPSNVEQGYVLRRLIRRAIRYGKLINAKNNLVAPVAEVIIKLFQDAYPELGRNQEFIIRELKAEEEKFGLALEKGMREFEKFSKIDGKIAFDLYQSYGFPLELTEELSKERGLKVDKNEFELEFKKHQELSRTASAGKFKGGLADNSEEVVKLHTATHLLHQALMDIFGGVVDQRGSNISVERLRFDFACSRKLTGDEIANLEKIVNQKIKEELPVRFELLTADEAKAKGAHGIFEDKYAQLGDKLKVYFIGDPAAGSGQAYSKEICGGPHVKNTREIGSFKIIKEEASSAGVRRIRAVIE
ncbi:MAG: alanine--tRNA ligase, partial [Patescibacteria group bacterium]|nr:alanine--tRNA ligase [Patescibacteria group bacterium]